MFQNPADGFRADRALGSSGSAKRRRERRLRAMLRHERQTVAMALAEKLHHSSRGQKLARAGRGARDEPHGCAPEDAPSQGRILRHVVGHVSVPSLDVPVPQMVDQLPDIEHFFAALSPDPEQVIEVPKISFDRVSQRLVERRLPQMVEQLVEVPTVLTPTRIALQIAEQLVSIPVPQVSVSGGGHQGSLSGQGSVGEQIVDILVLCGRGKRRVHGFLPEQSSTAQPVEQLVDIPSSRRGLYGSRPEQGTTAQTVEQIVDIPSGGVCGPGSSSAAAAADEDFTGGFSHFSSWKKSAECRAGQCGLAPASQLMDTVSL